MDIEIGEYVRTKRGKIAIVTDIDGSYVYADTTLSYTETEETYSKIIENDYVLKENIKNHSKNIIELLEVGDIVNGYKIIGFCDHITGEKRIVFGLADEEDLYRMSPNKIKTILTKEQYEQYAYKVEV